MRRALALLAIATSIAGCAAVQTQAAKVADALHSETEWQLCRAMTVGSWVRAYGADAKKAEAWRTLCANVPASTPGAPAPAP